MKIEIEYTVKKRVQVECNEFKDALDAVMQTEWANGNRLVERKPILTSRVVLEDNITIYDKSDGCHHLTEETLSHEPAVKRIYAIPEWMELLKVRMAEVRKNNPEFTEDKIKYIAKQNMPDMPREGWI